MFHLFTRKKSILPKDALGAGGEKAAADFLKRAGFQILQRNFSCPAGEIDLIALHEQTIVFVEVKTRRADDAAAPEDSIGPAKQRKLHQVAQYWLARHRHPATAYRFDAVSIVWPEDGALRIKHIVESFIPRGMGNSRPRL